MDEKLEGNDTNNLSRNGSKSENAQPKKRPICQRCERPIPRACICSALPRLEATSSVDANESSFISLKRSRILVLQHPKEIERKNRSLPLVSLCFKPPSSTKSNFGESCIGERTSIPKDFMFETVTARRLGETTEKRIMKILQDPNQDLLLFFPSPSAIPLSDAMELIQERRGSQAQDKKDHHNDALERKVTLLFLDATWKYAKEMEKACSKHSIFPQHIIRVKLSTQEFSLIQHFQHNQETFKPRRFDIRTPPSEEHLCTAECIALAASIVEDNNWSIYRTIMKPLDLMVKQWHSFYSHTNECPQALVSRPISERSR